ncbi:MAG: response regulator [Bacteroidetes bacterium]|nr:response regulator [Bacteroidota bacterium]
MTKLKTIIIDDELRARTLLKNILQEFCPDIEVIDSCEDLPNAVKLIRKTAPDLIFLDIEMPGHSGLELLDFFNEDEITFSIIFTTAYQQYALNAIKMEAFDYLLKPIEPEELVLAIDRFKRKHEQKTQKETVLSVNANKIAIPTSNGIKLINTEQIVYLKADNTYTEIYLDTNEKIVVSRTLKNFEDVLMSFPHFFRSNKSYIVNYNLVSEYIKSDGGYLVMQTKAIIPISPDKVSRFLELSSIVKR